MLKKLFWPITTLLLLVVSPFIMILALCFRETPPKS